MCSCNFANLHSRIATYSNIAHSNIATSHDQRRIQQSADQQRRITRGQGRRHQQTDARTTDAGNRKTAEPMPPPPHGLAPPHHRRGGGRISSRRLWDDARDPDAPPSALLRAVLYELQPVRYSSVRSFLRRWDYEASFRRSVSGVWSGAAAATGLVREAWVWASRWVWTVVRSSSWTDAVFVAAVVGYYYLVRYLHRLLEAGPFVVLVSATALILTVGLDGGGDGDEGDANRGGRMSAYSVFNRRCRSIMGSIDVEGLVNQYVGGNLGFAAGDRDRLRREEDAGDDDGVGGEAEADDHDGNGDGAAAGGGRSRKSGKKARRRNLEERRDRRRQREAAAAMGFAGDGGEAEAIAMNRLVEEEAAAAAAVAEEDFGIELQEAGFDG